MKIKTDELAAQIYIQWVREDGERAIRDREAFAGLADYALTAAAAFTDAAKRSAKLPSKAAIAKAMKKFPTVKKPPIKKKK